ncbi:MAG: hypothetical protein IKT70_03100 [Clostridia bacterium]|nr:hypothetical protein [Clostridia bacterium]
MVTYKELMFEALNNLLEDDEILMHPIYGLLNQGNTQYYGYFGFTQDYLLIALFSGTGKQITYTTRVPKIKKYCPDANVKVLDKGWLIFMTLCPTIIAIVLSLLS